MRKRPAPDDPPVTGVCKICRQSHHDFTCAVPGCGKTGTITDSTRHEASCSARWVCAHHFKHRD